MLEDFMSFQVDKVRGAKMMCDQYLSPFSCFYLGAKEYAENITGQYTNFLDVLNVFPSCLPPLGRLIGKQVVRTLLDT